MTACSRLGHTLRRIAVAALVLAPVAGTAPRAAADSTVRTDNQSEDTHTRTGESHASNSSSGYVGSSSGSGESISSDFATATATNMQDGNNSYDLDQRLSSRSGSGISGQVVGADVNGDLTLDAANRSNDVSDETGDAFGLNSDAVFVGLLFSTNTTITADNFSDVLASNMQDGDNELGSKQAAEVVSGDGVGGQVLGGIATGAIDATAFNTGYKVDDQTGDAENVNRSSSFAGLNVATDTELVPADFATATATNMQSGDDSSDIGQVARVSVGDAVGGQVAGFVSGKGTTAALSNVLKKSTTESGDGSFTNSEAGFTGLDVSSDTVTLADTGGVLASVFGAALN